MSDDALLSDLCSICHVNAIKYTCPRCGVHTCSLPCVKKHKLWAQCSGVRDPAEYRKRSELATESSIDKDFNFISKVERSLDRADTNVQDRGLILSPARYIHPNAHRPKHEIEIEERRITVQRAPKGLSRNKQNKTHWANQHKCIMWTIEWVFQDGEKIVGQGLETRKIGEAFINAVGKKNINRKRKRSDVARSSCDLKQDEVDAPAQANSVPVKAAKTDEELLSGLYFYLHRPNTMANMRCLVPLDHDSTLKEVLSGRTVLEFPTIHIRYETSESLPSPYIVESEYLERYGKDIPINLVSAPEEGEIDDTERLPSRTIDEKKVLEVLAKDLNG